MSSTKSHRNPRMLLAGSAVLFTLLTAACHELPPEGDDDPSCRPFLDTDCIPRPTIPAVPTVPTVPRLPTTTTTAARDTTAPSAPQNLVATSGDRQIRLDWSPSSDASGCRVYRKVGDGVFEVVGVSYATTYTDTGLQRGKKYSYYVTAYDGAGNESDPSNTVTARAS